MEPLLLRSHEEIQGVSGKDNTRERGQTAATKRDSTLKQCSVPWHIVVVVVIIIIIQFIYRAHI